MERVEIKKERIKTCFESEFLNVYDLNYAENRHYYVATRRTFDDMVAIKDDESYKTMVADAVSCIVIVRVKGEEDNPRLLLSYEFRYPTGQFLLGVPAGLVDKEDKNKSNPLIETAIREMKEETGITVSPDQVTVINPLLFSTPGMTDESNALVLVMAQVDNLDSLNREGAEATEVFDGFELFTVSEAKELLRQGHDKYGNHYSMYTWAALMWFTTQQF